MQKLELLQGLLDLYVVAETGAAITAKISVETKEYYSTYWLEFGGESISADTKKELFVLAMQTVTSNIKDGTFKAK